MERNTVIGFVLIFFILIGSFYLNKPSQEQLDAAKEQRRIQDSIALVQASQNEAINKQQQLNAINDAPKNQKNVSENEKKIQYGLFASNLVGENKISKISNDVMELTFSSKGAMINSVKLNNYKNQDSLPVVLFDKEHANFNFRFFSSDNRLINTNELNFKKVENNNPLEIRYRVKVDSVSNLDFVYTLKPDDYMLDFNIEGNNLSEIIKSNTTFLDFNWDLGIRQQEKGRKFEERYATLNYKFIGNDFDKLTKGDEEVSSKLKWIAFKDQFFSCIAIANSNFNSNQLQAREEDEKSGLIKSYSLTSSLDFDIRKNKGEGMRLFFGPLKYSHLQDYDNNVDRDDRLNLERLLPLGGSWIRWANTGIILPLFNLFGNFISNYGLIILLMTLVIKLIISPLTFKSYSSSAKMRVLQPEIQAINEKFPGNDKAAQKSQATMALYKKAGVSPMGGCLPMLLQMPILFAMYSFFPSSIELRHESFLWAQDLSTYDAIISWNANIPIISSILGNHLSLFCLLMTITNIIYTHINMKSQGSNSQVAGMKYMMYMMPLMFLFIFNQYSAALSFYFWISTLITIAQTYAVRLFIDEDKIRARLVANKNLKPNKKSGFAARLEKMQREQQKAMREKAKKGKIK